MQDATELVPLRKRRKMQGYTESDAVEKRVCCAAAPIGPFMCIIYN